MLGKNVSKKKLEKARDDYGKEYVVVQQLDEAAQPAERGRARQAAANHEAGLTCLDLSPEALERLLDLDSLELSGNLEAAWSDSRKLWEPTGVERTTS